MSLLHLIEKDEQIFKWQQGIEEGLTKQLFLGLAGSAKTLMLAQSFVKLQRSIVVVVANLYYANQLADDLKNIIDEVYVFPVDEVLSAEMAFASPIPLNFIKCSWYSGLVYRTCAISCTQ